MNIYILDFPCFRCRSESLPLRSFLRYRVHVSIFPSFQAFILSCSYRWYYIIPGIFCRWSWHTIYRSDRGYTGSAVSQYYGIISAGWRISETPLFSRSHVWIVRCGSWPRHRPCSGFKRITIKQSRRRIHIPYIRRMACSSQVNSFPAASTPPIIISSQVLCPSKRGRSSVRVTNWNVQGYNTFADMIVLVRYITRRVKKTEKSINSMQGDENRQGAGMLNPIYAR